MKVQLSSRAALLVIAALFILPLVLAWLMWTGVIDYKPGAVRNLGKLVQPPVPVDLANNLVMATADNSPDLENALPSFQGHWLILHAVPSPCPPGCMEAITGLRQVHKASGRNQTRIRIALLLQDIHEPETVMAAREVYNLFTLVEDPQGEIDTTLEQIATRFSSTVSGSSYLIDPIGNIMMYYEAGSDPNDLKKDLKRLLTWSKQDN
jgi:peroxiredoxin